MKKKEAKLLLLFILIPILLTAQQVTTTIEDIENSPGQYIGQTVTILGFVENYIESPSGTKYYMLKGDHGGIIKVNCTSQPTTKKKYYVTGIVRKDQRLTRPIIVETKRISLKEPPPKPVVVEHTTPEKETDYSWIYFVLGGLILVLVILLIVQVVLKKQEEPETSEATQVGTAGSSKAPKTIPSDSGGFKTITYTPDPKTMKFIPAELEIVSHEDKGKTFPLYGRSTAKGTILTIGRKSKTGHKNDIEIDPKFKTVSRKQAEIRAKGGKLYLKNLSETNPTKVNGKKLKPGEMPELNVGDNIRMGELEFEYKSVK